MNKTLLFLALIFPLAIFGAKPKHRYVKITTNKGECIIMLYNETPLHRDNFIKLTKAHFFNGTLFHRVIKGFMIQGGDPASKSSDTAGNGGPLYTIPAEFSDNLFHKRGVIAAAREGDDINPQKESSGSQFYLVQGKTYNDQQLDIIEKSRVKRAIPPYQRQIYKTLGGTPFLDNNYTVFGEIVKGIAMIDAIATQPTDKADKPLTDIKMTITLLKKRKAKKLEKELSTQKQL